MNATKKRIEKIAEKEMSAQNSAPRIHKMPQYLPVAQVTKALKAREESNAGGPVKALHGQDL